MRDGLQIQSDNALASVGALIQSAEFYKRQFLVLHAVLAQLVEEAGEGLEGKEALKAQRALKSKLDSMELAHLKAHNAAEKEA
jgi:hypothetical protein